MKKLLGAFAFVALFGVAACGGRDDDAVIFEDATIEQPGMAPIVTDPIEPLPPLTTDTMLLTDTVFTDTVIAP